MASYVPPNGGTLTFNFEGQPYAATRGDALLFNFAQFKPYVPPEGHLAAIAFGAEDYIPPYGFEVALEFVPKAAEQPGGEAQFIFPATVDSSGFGVPVIWHGQQFARGLGGFSQQAFGYPRIWNYQAYIKPTGYAGSAFGRVWLSQRNRAITPTGYSGAAFGRPTLLLFDQPIFPTGYDGAAFGRLFIENLNRAITPDGYSGAAFGRPTLVKVAQDFSLTGYDGASYGVPFVTYGRRYLDMQGYAGEGAIGKPLVMLKNRPIHLVGHSSAAFGKTWLRWEDDAKLTNFMLLLTV